MKCPKCGREVLLDIDDIEMGITQCECGFDMNDFERGGDTDEMLR